MSAIPRAGHHPPREPPCRVLSNPGQGWPPQGGGNNIFNLGLQPEFENIFPRQPAAQPRAGWSRRGLRNNIPEILFRNIISVIEAGLKPADLPRSRNIFPGTVPGPGPQGRGLEGKSREIYFGCRISPREILAGPAGARYELGQRPAGLLAENTGPTSRRPGCSQGAKAGPGRVYEAWVRPMLAELARAPVGWDPPERKRYSRASLRARE